MPRGSNIKCTIQRNWQQQQYKMYNSEKLATTAIQNVPFRETGNSSNTKCTIQRNWQQQQYKMYNSEKLTTAAIQNVQFRETGNIWCTRRRKTKQKYNTICVRNHYAQTNTNNVNKTWALLETIGQKKRNEHRFMQSGIMTKCK